MYIHNESDNDTLVLKFFVLKFFTALLKFLLYSTYLVAKGLITFNSTGLFNSTTYVYGPYPQ